jgi:hypothetical protein
MFSGKFAGLLLLLLLLFLLLLTKHLRFVEDPYSPQNKYEPHVALENDSCILYWDCTTLADKTVPFDRPDITLVDKTNKQAAFIDIAIPLPHKLQATITEKQRKYQELTFEIKQQWKLNKIFVIPHVLSATGFIP